MTVPLHHWREHPVLGPAIFVAPANKVVVEGVEERDDRILLVARLRYCSGDAECGASSLRRICDASREFVVVRRVAHAVE